MSLTNYTKRKTVLSVSGFVFVMLASICETNVIAADNLTYSPDQWPRHWNVLVNQNNNRYEKKRFVRQHPIRSERWGGSPVVRQKSRRTFRPEYNTSSHINNYYGQNVRYENPYSGAIGYGLARPYMSGLIGPSLMPGLSAPGIPFMNSMPTQHFMW